MSEQSHDDLRARSDHELIAMEQDRTLPIERWAAVEAELGRRALRGLDEPTITAERPTPVHGARPTPAPAAASTSSSASTASTISAAAALVLERGVAELESLLVPGERLLAVAIQRRLFALVHRRVTVGATTGRYIAITRGLFGGYTPYDVRWQDLEDADIRAGIFGASLTITALASADLGSHEHPGRRTMVTGLQKQQAQDVYRICQTQEQAWREKRRVRDLTEMRAESGGLQLGGMTPGGGAAAPAGDAADRLRRAREMLDAGLITDTEYESIKARVVDGL